MAAKACSDIIAIDQSKVQYAVPRNNLLTGLLIKDRAKVLFVGEGDFTFTVAFAAYRQGQCPKESGSAWDGIISTRYEPVGPEGDEQYVGECRLQCKPAPTLSEVKFECVSSFIDHLAKELIVNLPRLPTPKPWLYGIDATALPLALTQDQQAIWFQCPWVARNTRNYSAKDLIINFLLNLAAQLQADVCVCVGIANHPDYAKHYDFKTILDICCGDTATQGKYRFVGADDQLIKELLDFGYHHRLAHEDVDLHKTMFNHHVTLVFKRNILKGEAILSDLLIEDRAEVLFVGERDFTFTVAFAAYRQSRKRSGKPWEGITSTRYEPPGPVGELQYVGETLMNTKPAPVLSDVKLKCLSFSRDYFLKLLVFQYDFKEIINSIPDVPAGTWLCGIDPLAVPTDLIRFQQVVWLLCPWTSARETYLLLKFLLDLRNNINPGVHVCISSPVTCPCTVSFLKDIQKKSAHSELYIITRLYSFVGIDNTLVVSLLRFGYAPKNHDNQSEDHVTLVLKSI